MAKHTRPSVCALKAMLSYDEGTGRLFWRKRPSSYFVSQHRANAWNARYAGRQAFTSLDTHGYHHGSILGRNYLAHRVVWAMLVGRWPAGQIDHLNHNRVDNRIENLREVSALQNARNASLRADNTSGLPGIRKRTDCDRWEVHIGGAGPKGRNRKYLGLFASFEDAVEARRKAERERGYHANHGEVLYG